MEPLRFSIMGYFMKQIKIITDKEILGTEGFSDAKPRITARAIVKTRDERYALMYARKYDLYSLPGGGVEGEEAVTEALKREVFEETGCSCDSIEPLGYVEENRAHCDYTQISYYYVVTTDCNDLAPSLTEAEAGNGTEVGWYSLEEVYDRIAGACHTTNQRKFLQARDLAALDTYRRNREWIRKTEAFLNRTFDNSPAMQKNPSARDYRQAHSYRVANIGKAIAIAEGFDPTEMVIACLLHDISYCTEFQTREAARDHGRLSAKLARPFLEELGMPEERAADICYGIAIHVDDTADFEGERTAFAETVSDADNIDRFDAYRIYDNLAYAKFREIPLEEKKEHVTSMLARLERLRGMKLATKTAETLWRERIDFYWDFFRKLEQQFEASERIL